MALLTLLLACAGSTGGSNGPPEGDTDTDTDSDTDTDTDTDTDSDTDTGIETVTTDPGWPWGGAVGAGAADASIVGTPGDGTGLILSVGDVDGSGKPDLLVGAPGDLSVEDYAASRTYVVRDGHVSRAMGV